MLSNYLSTHGLERADNAPFYRITQKTTLPTWVMESSEMNEIVKECNFIIIVYVSASAKLGLQCPNQELQCERHSVTQERNCESSTLNKILVPRPDQLMTRNQATDCVVNLVPVLYKSGQTLDRVIPHLIDEMHVSRDRLDSAAAKLHAMTQSDPQLNQDVTRFIDGIRIMDTGTLEYS